MWPGHILCESLGERQHKNSFQLTEQPFIFVYSFLVGLSSGGCLENFPIITFSYMGNQGKMLPLLIVWRTWILLLFILGIPHMLMLTMACSADVFGDTQRLLMFLNRWCLDMQACWAVAYLTLDVFHMRCFFHRDKTAWFAIASCVTGQALRVVFFPPHLEDTKVS